MLRPAGLVPGVVRFARGVEDQHERCKRVGPPPAGRRVQQHADQDHRRERCIDHGDAGFGLQQLALEARAGVGFAIGQREHRQGRDPEPSRAGRGAPRAIGTGERDRRLDRNVDRRPANDSAMIRSAGRVRAVVGARGPASRSTST
jgi:hypothetical protein